jgi:D-beta-D-heptose 7-phosphate kinase/D-beta-D-heptose 1-phosphate adenosyltransferase
MISMQAIIERFSGCKVLVVGDAILDVYMTGVTDRLCREAPVPVINLLEQKSFCGGAANTALNLAALGARPYLMTVVGNDPSGRELSKILQESGVDTSCILFAGDRRTIVKRRISSSYNILVRVDEGNTDPISDESGRSMAGLLERFSCGLDAVVVSDYGYGVVTTGLIRRLSKLVRQTGIPLVVDAKDLRQYKDFSPVFVKPNYDECIKILNIPKRLRQERVGQIMREGKRLLEVTGAGCVAATLDTDGVLLFEKGRKPYRISAEPRNHKETIGAGDTFLSAAALAFYAGATARTAVRLASAAASVVLGKEGTGICFNRELMSYFNGDQKFITSLDELAGKVDELKSMNRKVVFTNGCFDILHRGHVTFLNQAKALGDILIVGLNTDESIRKVKGYGRPINTLEDRVAVLSALHCVNHLIAFEEDSPVRILKALKPDLFVKGGTYTIDSLPEGKLVESLGGKVRIIPFVAGLSTTKLIEKIRKPLPDTRNVETEGRLM